MLCCDFARLQKKLKLDTLAGGKRAFSLVSLRQLSAGLVVED